MVNKVVLKNTVCFDVLPSGKEAPSPPNMQPDTEKVLRHALP
jgi:hypothetical protein